jgi:serine/threonine protein kinase
MIRGHRCIRQVGSGGMCTIYLAESERAGTLVVLKVFSQVPDVSERIVGFDRFLQEYEIVAGLKHRNIVRIYDLGVADDHAYIAMEHFPAGDLRQRMKTPLSRRRRSHYSGADRERARGHPFGRRAAPGLEARQRDAAHRRLAVLDRFRTGQGERNRGELTGTREIFGTPYYMSPEQGHAEEIDARSDLYSLGVMFYEMLTGRKPYTGATAMEVIYKHKRAELPEIAPQFAEYEALLRAARQGAGRPLSVGARIARGGAALKIPA